MIQKMADISARVQKALMEASQPVVVNPEECVATDEDLRTLMKLADISGPTLEEEYVAATQQLTGTIHGRTVSPHGDGVRPASMIGDVFVCLSWSCR